METSFHFECLFLSNLVNIFLYNMKQTPQKMKKIYKIIKWALNYRCIRFLIFFNVSLFNSWWVLVSMEETVVTIITFYFTISSVWSPIQL